jgi:sterol desaturase/sphingolipid hydroxylase (fatty acid hydroxylase superfamily)
MDFDLTTRLALIGLTFFLLAVFEAIWPQREQLFNRAIRWRGNLGVFLFDVLVIGIPLNGIVFGILYWTESQNIGLMNWMSLPFSVKVVIGFLALDAMFYFQHRISHFVPLLWRLHRVHHADTGMDLTTANRIHPLETVWVTLLRVSLAVILGIPIAAFIAFVVSLNLLSMFSHANLRLPPFIDWVLRLLIVTPSMHETHHSSHRQDFDTNFAFVFSFWDRLFGTYKNTTTALDAQIELGLDEFRGVEDTGVLRLLTMPFRNSSARETIVKSSSTTP